MLFHEIAAGGMATVHFGRLIGEGGFSRTVAVKCLHAHFAKDQEFAEMFLDEARLAARIQHMNVVAILDVVAREGELFIIMEYVHGESLSKLIKEARKRKTPLPPKVVSAIVIGALEGLHAAHEAKSEQGEPLGIVHRDVSPQNVMVGVDGIAKVLDFGVAKAAGRMQTTRDGQIKGKLAYMAPEQLKAQDVDRRTDIYAASVMLWEALTGRRLFKADDDVGLFGMVLHAQVEPPSSVVPSLPPELDAVVMRGLERDPEKRFATARDMAEALEKAVGYASAREVGSWVEKLASDTLDVRSQKIVEVESFTSSKIRAMMAEHSSLSDSGSFASPSIDLAGSASAISMPASDGVSSGPVSLGVLPPPRLPPRSSSMISSADLAGYLPGSDSKVDLLSRRLDMAAGDAMAPLGDQEVSGISSLSSISNLSLSDSDSGNDESQRSSHLFLKIGAVTLLGSVAIVGLVMLLASALKHDAAPAGRIVQAGDAPAAQGLGSSEMMIVTIAPQMTVESSTEVVSEPVDAGEGEADVAAPIEVVEAEPKSHVSTGADKHKPVAAFTKPSTKSSSSTAPSSPVTSSTKSTSSSSNAGCDPPYYIDHRRVKVPKPHCL